MQDRDNHVLIKEIKDMTEDIFKNGVRLRSIFSSKGLKLIG